MRRHKQARTTEESDPYLPGHGDWSYDVESYDLEIDYRVATNRLDGRASIVVITRCELDRLALDLRGLDVSKLLVDGVRPGGYSVRGGRVRVQLGRTVPAGTHLVLSVRYGGAPSPQDSDWGDVGWEELTDGVIVAGQPAGAPSWFPCNDRPSSKAVYRICVTTESAYTVVANGRLAERRPGASRTAWRFEQAQPMAPYLATVQIGRYETRRLTDSPVPQHIVAPVGAREDALVDFGRQGAMMSTFVETFGPYPFDHYVVVVTEDSLEIPLEAQGLSVFGRNHVDGERGLERLVAHELAHQWFGNSLTVATWSDIWLHEGFACYAEWLWSERSGGRSAGEHARDHHRRLADEDQDLLVADPGPDLMFDDRVYKRGALALHAVRESLGDAAFFPMLRAWADRHRYGNVTTVDFIAHARQYGEVDDLLERWLFRRPLPAL